MKSRYPSSFASLRSWAAEAGVSVAEARVRLAQYGVLRAIAGSRRLSSILVFKGGNALDFVWQPNRSTEDLDFSADMAAPGEPLGVNELNLILARLLPASGRDLGIDLRLHSVKQQPPGHDKTFITYDINVGYVLQDEIALLRRVERGAPSTNVILVEISINEPICADTTIDIDAANPLRVSTVEDIVAEKLRALLQQKIRNRTRRQDLLDIAVLIKAHHQLDYERISRYLLTKAEAKSVPVSRAAFKDPEIISRASQDYDSLRQTTRDSFVEADEARDLLYQLVDRLDIPDK